MEQHSFCPGLGVEDQERDEWQFRKGARRFDSTARRILGSRTVQSHGRPGHEREHSDRSPVHQLEPGDQGYQCGLSKA